MIKDCGITAFGVHFRYINEDLEQLLSISSCFLKLRRPDKMI